MRILIFSIFYYPDGGPAAPLFTMLSEALVRRGHMVTVITTVPHYPSGKVQAAYKSLTVKKTIENGVYVIRVPVPSVDRKRLSVRFLQFIIYQILATLYSLRLDFDVFTSANPALEVWLPFTINAVVRRKPSIFSVHDIYPDVGVKLGIFKDRFTIGMIRWLEKYCLVHARIIRVLSSSFISSVQAYGIPKSKIRLIYDWVEVDKIKILPKSNSFSKEYLLNDTFNIIYAGNIGPVQGLDTVLGAALLLQKEKQIEFVFIGDGAAKSDLVEKAKQQGLNNVVFLPYQPRDRMAEIWASADVALVVLLRGTGLGALPSKTFSILASNRPILVSVDEDSETCKLVQRADAGLCVPPENAAKLAEAILTLKKDNTLCERLGHNGRIWAEQHHSPQFAAEQYEKLFVEAVVSQKL
jgi:colanic acid biosynthesis glycosyl transferase WcaI